MVVMVRFFNFCFWIYLPSNIFTRVLSILHVYQLVHGYSFFLLFFIEMSTIALDVARKTFGGYTIVPCCIRDNVFGVKTKSSYNRWKMSDDIRYAVQVGYLGGSVKCDRVANFDRRITNRNLMILGNFKKEEEKEEEEEEDEAAAATTATESTTSKKEGGGGGGGGGSSSEHSGTKL